MNGDASQKIEILLAAHDGERHLAEQLDSLLAQTHEDWHLTIRDDRSTDATVAIAREYAARHPDRIVVQERETASGSATRNFLEMVADSRASYVMLCDQDDVWLEDKVALTLDAMHALEAAHGGTAPLLVHTDLMVTDARLHLMHRSMTAAQQLDGRETRLARLVTQNMVTGCTVMINRPLTDLVGEPFDGVVMHDWWLALIAAAFGGIGFLGTPTVLYRQHEANVVGARPSHGLGYKVRRLLDREGVTRSLRDSCTQASAFLTHFEDRLSTDQRELLQAFTSIPTLGKAERLWTLRRYGFWKNTLARRLGQVWFV